MVKMLKRQTTCWLVPGCRKLTCSVSYVSDYIKQQSLESGKISLFLTHGGYNSLSESLYSATPMVLVPLFADQFRNANLAKKRGVGLVVEKSEFNANVISAQIKSILSDSR
jgi:UDP:flavonoid glycosyltransferase YjiC (YdhE family)